MMCVVVGIVGDADVVVIDVDVVVDVVYVVDNVVDVVVDCDSDVLG